ncbi:hypothetical protein K435DRAFT_766755 [Dendrothele bispora CBS 962.96]|uniref:LigT-like protein n=1 Tax=Dendrothele bispora (strain CBS 962.96) TaxID=1314807 RepID=A0A4S8L2N9_DENBC|nr:hypothetical protein K435DRAFT_766755 [Dendrothele bispora CBS 962.96]
MGYALWLVPAEQDLQALQLLMNFRPKHCNVTQGSRSYPKFAPHITLATFDLSNSSDKPPLLSRIVPQNTVATPVFFESLRVGNTYWGTMSIDVTKSQPLDALHQKIKQQIQKHGIQPQSKRFPHMALFYVEEAEERLRLREALSKTQRIVKLKDNKVGLYPDPNPFVEPMSGFNAAAIWMVDCRSRFAWEWKVLEKYQLQPFDHVQSTMEERKGHLTDKVKVTDHPRGQQSDVPPSIKHRTARHGESRHISVPPPGKTSTQTKRGSTHTRVQPPSSAVGHYSSVPLARPPSTSPEDHRSTKRSVLQNMSTTQKARDSRKNKDKKEGQFNPSSPGCVAS